MMRDIDQKFALDGLLADWHIWNQRTADRAGYAGRAAGFGAHRSSSQYDWENNIESDLVDKRIMEGFHEATNRVRDHSYKEDKPEIYTALQFEARNLAVRYQVWASPRLPKDPVALQALIHLARERLLKELHKDGVLC